MGNLLIDSFTIRSSIGDAMNLIARIMHQEYMIENKAGVLESLIMANRSWGSSELPAIRS